MARRRTNEFMENLLRSWYGKERGEGEMLRYTPETRSIAEPLDRVMRSLVPPWEWKIAKIKSFALNLNAKSIFR